VTIHFAFDHSKKQSVPINADQTVTLHLRKQPTVAHEGMVVRALGPPHFQDMLSAKIVSIKDAEVSGFGAKLTVEQLQWQVPTTKIRTATIKKEQKVQAVDPETGEWKQAIVRKFNPDQTAFSVEMDGAEKGHTVNVTRAQIRDPFIQVGTDVLARRSGRWIKSKVTKREERAGSKDGMVDYTVEDSLGSWEVNRTQIEETILFVGDDVECVTLLLLLVCVL